MIGPYSNAAVVSFFAFLAIIGILLATSALLTRERERRLSRDLPKVAAGLGLRYAHRDPFDTARRLELPFFRVEPNLAALVGPFAGQESLLVRVADVMWGSRSGVEMNVLNATLSQPV